MGLAECAAKPKTDSNADGTVVEEESAGADWHGVKPVATVRRCSCQQSGSVTWLRVPSEKLVVLRDNHYLVPRSLLVDVRAVGCWQTIADACRQARVVDDIGGCVDTV